MNPPPDRSPHDLPESVGPGRGEFPAPHSPFEPYPATHSQP
jgi:hypothetical protein